MEEVKMLPYGVSNFEQVRRENLYCTDKSMFIPDLEKAGRFLFLIRPRRFGKSLFLSMLKSYYDMANTDKFDELFDGMWIHEHPTEECGKYQVVHFDFSKAASGLGDLKTNFHKYCSAVLCSFIWAHEKDYGKEFCD